MKGRGIKGVGKEIKRDGGIKGSSRGDDFLRWIPFFCLSEYPLKNKD
jgi:hypothetical protein